jgi:hypothetical protein
MLHLLVVAVTFKMFPVWGVWVPYNSHKNSTHSQITQLIKIIMLVLSWEVQTTSAAQIISSCYEARMFHCFLSTPSYPVSVSVQSSKINLGLPNGLSSSIFRSKLCMNFSPPLFVLHNHCNLKAVLFLSTTLWKYSSIHSRRRQKTEVSDQCLLYPRYPTDKRLGWPQSCSKGVFAVLRSAYWNRPVRPSVCMHATTQDGWTDFNEICNWGVSMEFVDKFHKHLLGLFL